MSGIDLVAIIAGILIPTSDLKLEIMRSWRLYLLWMFNKPLYSKA